MVFSTAAVVFALVVNSAPASNPSTPPQATSPRIVTAQPIRDAAAIVVPPERWQVDEPHTRPAALAFMYATFGALQVADVYSTRHALGAKAYEANPLMRNASRNAGAMLAVRALSTAGTIYFAERAWKKNRAGAVVLMAVINGVSAAVTARNLRNAR